MSSLAVLIAAEESTARELPIPPWLVGVLAVLAFAFLLGVTWSFRGTANKYAPPQAHGEHTGHGAPTGEDTPHWPESHH